MRNRESDVNETSDFMIRDARGLLFVVRDIDLEIGEQRGRFSRERAQTRDRHAANLELRALAAAELEREIPSIRRTYPACSSTEPCPCFLMFSRYSAVLRFAGLCWLM